MAKTDIVNFLDKLIYSFIILLPFSISVAPAFTNFFWAAIIIFYLIKKIILKENPIIYTPINAIFLLFIFISSVSILNSINITSSLRGVFKLFQYGLLFVVMSAEIKDKRHIEIIIISMILGGVFSSADAFWQLIFGKDFVRGNAPIMNIGLKRATAAFPNANVLAIYLAPIFVISVGMAMHYLKGKRKLVMFFISSVIFIGLMFTYSRLAIIASFISLFLIAISKKNKVFITLIITALIVSPLFFPKGLKDWMKSINYNPIVFLCNTDRISIYKNTVNMIKHHPIIGVGVGTFSSNYLKYKLPEPDDAKTGDTIYAHNNFLHIAGEVGLVGLLIFLFLLCKIFNCIYIIYKKTRDSFYRSLCLSLNYAVIAFLINGFAETSLYYKRVSVIFYFMVGLILALYKISDGNYQREY